MLRGHATIILVFGVAPIIYMVFGSENEDAKSVSIGPPIIDWPPRAYGWSPRSVSHGLRSGVGSAVGRAAESSTG